MTRHCWPLMAAPLLGLFLAPGCSQPASKTPAPPQGGSMTMAWSVTSSAFKNEGNIPKKYTCDGDNISPPLAWTEAPEGAKELVLICEDPDAPRGTFTHWLIWAIPPELTDLPEAVPPMEHAPAVGGARQGRNTGGKIGYTGPCPPPGKPHHYWFRLYALDAATDLQSGASKAELLKAMEGHILSQAELLGMYGR